eukprot:CAMPEP_0168527182 /NCGR_PEP_ID=MMETSP0405-20121227/12441_1 /TAXON_ID=498012 /ORGANISM="Trichosphaerium sp, Strain Am-I-7 wt" /LENGTH=566 /DNA_ID=CAMNT_0008550227 /DNA_START=467 /DNA_END=2163 /DNA_ORIENTATION=-
MTIPLGLSPTRAFSTMLPFLRIQRMKKAVLVCDKLSPLAENSNCDALMDELPRIYNVQPTRYEVLPGLVSPTLGLMDPQRVANWSATASIIYQNNQDADVLFFGSPGISPVFIIRRFVDLGWFPKLIVGASADGFYSDLGDLSNIVPLRYMNLITGLTRFVRTSRFSKDKYTGYDLAAFMEAYKNKTNTELPLAAPIAGFLSSMMWVESIKKADTLDHMEVLDKLQRSEFNTFNGQYSWDPEDNSNRWNPYYIQVQMPNGSENTTDVIKVLAPLGATTTSEIVYPIPQPHQRFVSVEFGHTSEIVMSILTGIAIVITFAFCVFVGMARNHRVVRGSSINFLLLVAFGAILMLCTNFVWFPSQWTTFTCHLAFYTFNIGFSIMFGSLFAKSLRVVMIMRQANKLKVVVVSDTHVFFYVLSFVLVDLVLLILYSIIVNPTSKLNYPDPYRLDMAYKTCVTKNDTTNTVFIALFASYKCLLMLVGIYTGWEVHYIKYKHLNESKVIAFALYNVIFFAVLGFGFSYALNDDSNETTRYGLYALRSLSVVLGAGLTIVALFLQKILLIKGL